jgi:hypothetical protein
MYLPGFGPIVRARIDGIAGQRQVILARKLPVRRGFQGDLRLIWRDFRNVLPVLRTL